MSLNQCKNALNIFSSTTSTLQAVRRNLYDDIYRGLGVTQASSIFLLTASWLGFMFPQNGIRPVETAYFLLHNATRKEINSPNVSDSILDYVLWLAGALMTIHIGARLGQFVWATYCLLRTGCRSHHTMDLPLPREKRDHIRNSMITQMNENNLLLSEKVKTIEKWILRALLFMSSQKALDKKRGKIEQADRWWALKKRFRSNGDGMTLYHQLHCFAEELQHRRLQLETITASAESLKSSLDSVTEENLMSLIRDTLEHFKLNTKLSTSPQPLHKSDVTFKAINIICNKVINKKINADEALRALLNILNQEIQNLKQEHARVPLGPNWMQTSLSNSLQPYYKAFALKRIKTCSSQLARAIKQQPESQQEQLLQDYTQELTRQTRAQINQSPIHTPLSTSREFSPIPRNSSEIELLDLEAGTSPNASRTRSNTL